MFENRSADEITILINDADLLFATFKRKTLGENETQIARVQRELEILGDSLGRPPIIANVGLLKAGKSTLFNALTGEKELFATADVRCTIEQQRHEAMGFQFIDTPGLDANEQDTAAAEEVLKRANIVLFVHSVTNGELDRDELSALRDLCGHFQDIEIRKRSLVPVITKCEGVAVETVEQVKQKILSQWIEATGFEPLEFFAVRSETYFGGKEKNQPKLTEHSNIPALLSHIQRELAYLEATHLELVRGRIVSLITECQDLALNLAKNMEEEAEGLEKTNRSRIRKIREEFNELAESIYTAHSAIRG